MKAWTGEEGVRRGGPKASRVKYVGYSIPFMIHATLRHDRIECEL